MKKIFYLIILLVAILVLSGCSVQESKPTVCTQDAKICPDGTSVGRNADNNCEINECSSEKPIPVEPDGGIGDTQTTDNGKTAAEEKKWIATSPEKCQVVKFMCIKGSKAFFDDTGCGCEPDNEASDSKLKAFDCTEPRPSNCSIEYEPVCGQVQIECIRAPCNPIMQTYGNKCHACSNPRVMSYTIGACRNT